MARARMPHRHKGNRPKGNLSRGHGDPLYRQIYDRFRKAISTGQLQPGDRLPSLRDLAAELATARGTVDTAYAMLAGEGYVVSRGPAGTIVAPELDKAVIAGAAAKQLLPSTAREPPWAEPKLLQIGLPAVDAFPRKLWAHVVAREARRLSAVDLIYPDPAGLHRLRQTIAAYLASSRGIGCEWQQVIVTNGFQGGLNLTLPVVLGRNKRVWIEDPCFPPARAALEAFGAVLTPIRVDAEGVRVADGLKRAPSAKLAVVTPSHQSPLGVALSLPRRLSLLRWANEANAYVLEDDYDSEFRFVGRPLPALKSLDREQRVIYAGTFSKALFPGLRLGYLVVPPRLLEAFVAASSSQTSGQTCLAQGAVAAFMADGHFARHLKRMRKLYARRRAALADALVAEFGARIKIDMLPGGMHLVSHFAAPMSDVALAGFAQTAGFKIEPLSKRAIKHTCGQGLLVGFTNVAETDAPEVARQLRRALERQLDAAPKT